MSKMLSVSLAICAFVLGAGAGYYMSLAYGQGGGMSLGMGLGRADRNFDLRYINAMAAHHRGAMLLAEQVKDRTDRGEVRSLAADILKTEPLLINELYGWKKEWYGDSRPAGDPEVANLGDYDEKLDLRFLNALIAHHEEGILMAKEARLKSSRNQILNNADEVEKFLKDTGQILKEWREDWYGVN